MYLHAFPAVALCFTVTSIPSNSHAVGACDTFGCICPHHVKPCLPHVFKQEKKIILHFQTLVCLNLVTPQLWKLDFCLTLCAPVLCMTASDIYIPFWVVLSGSSLCLIFKINFFPVLSRCGAENKPNIVSFIYWPSSLVTLSTDSSIV